MLFLGSFTVPQALNWMKSLHAASSKGYFEIVKCLIANGAMVDGDKGDWNPLYVAAKEGHLEIVKCLVENGATVNVIIKDGWTPLHMATYNGNHEIVKFLIQNGAEINAKTIKDGISPLHLASEYGYLESVKCLIENGAKAEPKNNKGEIPHLLAARFDHTDVVDFLKKTKKRKAETDVPEESFSNKAPCVICSEPRHGFFVLLPCGHTSLCEACCINLTCKGNKNGLCPTCRKPVAAYNKIFFQMPT